MDQKRLDCSRAADRPKLSYVPVTLHHDADESIVHADTIEPHRCTCRCNACEKQSVRDTMVLRAVSLVLKQVNDELSATINDVMYICWSSDRVQKNRCKSIAMYSVCQALKHG